MNTENMVKELQKEYQAAEARRIELSRREKSIQGLNEAIGTAHRYAANVYGQEALSLQQQQQLGALAKHMSLLAEAEEANYMEADQEVRAIATALQALRNLTEVRA